MDHKFHPKTLHMKRKKSMLRMSTSAT